MTPQDQDAERYFTLVSGHRIPAVGLGTWRSGSRADDSVFTAIVGAGYRHIDTAAEYGVHKEVGFGLQAAMNAGIRKEDIFITIKLWCSDLSPDRVRITLNNALQELQVDYLDLLVIHWPFHLKKEASRPPKEGEVGEVLEFELEGVWREMEKLAKGNLVRDIGISNFTSKKLDKLAPFCPNNAQPFARWKCAQDGEMIKCLRLVRKMASISLLICLLGPPQEEEELIHDEAVERIAKNLEQNSI